MKHLFIVNPESGKGKARSFIPRIHEIFKDRSEDYLVEITKGPGHAIEIVKEYVFKDDYRVYSVGGDGTLNEVINGLAGTNSSLGIIPCGTGNDFVKSINSEYQSDFILEKLIGGYEILVDLGTVNGKYFINISSIGIDADIAYNSKRFKNIPFVKGQLAYIMAVFSTLRKYRSKVIHIDIDGNSFSTTTLLLSVANGKFYGGGMKVAPYADLKDGLFDICHVKSLSKIKIPFLFPRLIKGTHESIDEVTFYKAKKVRIRCNELLALNLDGEIIKAKEAEFKILPKAIKVIVPRL